MRCLALLLLVSGSRAGAGELEDLLEAADGPHWRTRWTAVRSLARLPEAERRRLKPLLLEADSPRVRAAIAQAVFLEPSLGNATLLGIVVRKDPDPAARRAAARALVRFRDRRAVAALVEALGTETDRRCRLQIVDTLRALTPAPCLLDAARWREWWSRNRHDPRLRPADEPARKATYEGVVLETKTVASVRPEGGPKRPAPHVLVLPRFGWTTAAFGPYLLPLRAKATLTWVRLPTNQELTGRSGYGGDVPVYPVSRLVAALDRFRTAARIDRFLILAHGASGWIAMRYAQRHPRHCSGLVLIDTALDKQAYGDALRRGARHGTKAERFVARTLLHENNVPFDESTLNRLNAIGLERGFLDRGDLEIAQFYYRARAPQGFATVPDIAWGKRARLDLPTLFLYSAGSVFSGHADDERIARHFPLSLVAPLKEARGMPFVEANAKFHDVVNAFLKRYDLAS